MEHKTSKEAQEDAIYVTGKVTLPHNVLSVSARHVLSLVTVHECEEKKSGGYSGGYSKGYSGVTQGNSQEEADNARSRKKKVEEQTHD